MKLPPITPEDVRIALTALPALEAALGRLAHGVVQVDDVQLIGDDILDTVGFLVPPDAALIAALKVAAHLYLAGVRAGAITTPVNPVRDAQTKPPAGHDWR